MEEERKRLSLEIHDGLNAQLVSIKLNAQRIVSAIRPSSEKPTSPINYQEIAEDTEKMVTAVSEAYTFARAVVKSLRPEVLDTLGLEQAIHELAHQLESNYPQCTCLVNLEPDLLNFRGDAEIIVYRVVQECLINVVKHAKASKALITAKRDHTKNVIIVCVQDNRAGFDVATRTKGGVGLIGMVERAQSVDGSIQIDSTKQGTKICLLLPLEIITASPV